MKFEQVTDGLSADECQWLTTIPDIDPPRLASMVGKIRDGHWKLWRLVPPAKGLAVTYPQGGRLFVYYLSGIRLFDRLSREDLIEVARHEGLLGMAAETQQLPMVRILSSLGFEVRDQDPYFWYLELDDVRR